MSHLNKEKKMIKFTKKERLFLSHAINDADGSNSILWSSAKWIGKQLGWEINTLKGVFGSLEKKDVIAMSHVQHEILWNGKGKGAELIDTKMWYFTAPVCSDHYGEDIRTVDQLEKFLNIPNWTKLSTEDIIETIKQLKLAQ